MSEALDKVAGIDYLPLFPLPLVMLPGEVLPLHIFEERYRQMLRDIESGRRLFGITLFDPQQSFIEQPATGTVGCVAELRESETLPDGRSNIITQGIIRYRLLDYIENGSPYLVGHMEFFEDEPADAHIEKLADEVFVLFERMAKAAFRMGGNRGTFPEIQRSDPEALSFLITAAYNFENQKKYHLLEMTSTQERLAELHGILEQTVGQMEESADIQSASRTNGHSKKKIDL
ncbi:MAG: LON peptidase substrate-binding domain-containing protein [Acidobacteria bacterium]|nr:LON peptidase substrate-binding domain-containing protein [Acidobacteriota bacterium]